MNKTCDAVCGDDQDGESYILWNTPNIAYLR